MPGTSAAPENVQAVVTHCSSMLETIVLLSQPGHTRLHYYAMSKAREVEPRALPKPSPHAQMIAQVARIDPRAAELITKFTYQPPPADPNVRIVLPWEPQTQASQPASSSSSSAPLPPVRFPWDDPLSDEVMSLVNPEVPTCLSPPPRPPPADETNEEVRAQWGL